MNSKVLPTLLHFSRTFFIEDKKKIAVRRLQGTSVHVCAFETSASLRSTESPCKQDDITFYFSSFLAHYFISISPVITNWQHMLAFSSIIFNIAYREISAKVSLCHWHVRQHWKYSPTRKLATSTIYSFFEKLFDIHSFQNLQKSQAFWSIILIFESFIETINRVIQVPVKFTMPFFQNYIL